MVTSGFLTTMFHSLLKIHIFFTFWTDYHFLQIDHRSTLFCAFFGHNPTVPYRIPIHISNHNRAYKHCVANNQRLLRPAERGYVLSHHVPWILEHVVN